MKRFALPLLIVFFAAVAATVIVSAGEMHAAEKGEKKMSPLPVEVKSQVEKLNLQHRLDNIDLNARRMELRGQMKEELLKAKPDAKALEKIAKEMDGVRAKLHRQKIEHLLKVKQVLPEEHWKVFLHKQCGSFAGCCCMHGAAGCRHGKAGCTCGMADCPHGAAGCRHGKASCTCGMADCRHGEAGSKHGATGCMRGAAGSKHGVGAGCPMMSPGAADADQCPMGKHGKAK